MGDRGEDEPSNGNGNDIETTDNNGTIEEVEPETDITECPDPEPDPDMPEDIEEDEDPNQVVDMGDQLVKDLVEQVDKIDQLLVAKEKEWSAILRVKKHLEFALDQVKCTQRMAKSQDDMIPPMSATELKACIRLIVSEKEAFTIAKRQTEENTDSMEIENESLQTVFPFRAENKAPRPQVKSRPKSSYGDQINMSPDRQFSKILEKVMKIETGTKSPIRSAANNSSTPSTTTLAKMLSPSTQSSIVTNSNDLSLANLLASSKVETKINASSTPKVKKERGTREEPPICQGCNLSRAQFVCAGCANQWYCSRECQVAAWDEHSEICSG